MKLVAAVCPSCGAKLNVNPNEETVVCKYCSSTIIIQDAIAKYKIEISGNVEISNLPKVLYGSDINIVQTFSYLVDFISKNFENYTLSIKISNLLVRNKCHLKFSLVVDSKYNNLDMYEKDNKYTLPIGAKLQSPKRIYIIEQVLGQGGFGITYKVSANIRVDNVTIRTFFAVKEFFMKESCERDRKSTRLNSSHRL